MENEKNNLEKSISENEKFSVWGGKAVVAGLIIEIILAVAYREHKTWIENWAPVLADALIALGVIVEIHFAGNVSKSEETLRRISEEKVAEFNALAAKAFENSALLEKELEIERIKRLELERRMAPRSTKLDGNTVPVLLESLRPLVGKHIFVQMFISDPETAYFAEHVINLFRQVGINVQYGSVLSGFVPPGMSCKYGKNRYEDVVIILNSFNFAGALNHITAWGNSCEIENVNELMMTIGVKD